MEVCVDSIESAFNAARGGASRLEVCSSLAEGGLTPSPGVMSVIAENVTIPCYAMIRPRAGDFVYSELELKAMEHDIEVMVNCGAVGLVLGCLTTQAQVDTELVTRLANVARSKLSSISLTFHRAIDMTPDIHKSAETIVSLGFDRILTSGGKKTAYLGVDNISKMVSDLGKSIIVMPGSGITEENLEEIQLKTKCVEFHASARVPKKSQVEFKSECEMGSNGEEYTTMVTSKDKVANLIKIYKATFFK